MAAKKRDAPILIGFIWAYFETINKLYLIRTCVQQCRITLLIAPARQQDNEAIFEIR